MKRIAFALVFACGAGSCIGVEAATSKPHVASKTETAKEHAARVRAENLAAQRAAKIKALAPADEYFGPLKLSIIGINNSMHDTGLRYDYNHDLGNRSYDSAMLIERAIRDWANRYPKDDQLPRSIFFLQRLYTKILTQQSRDHAHVVAVWMFSKFDASPQARQLHKTLASEHLAPIDSVSPPAEATVVPAPSETPAATTPVPLATPGAMRTPVAAPSPAPSATPSVVPSGTPAPAAVPGSSPSVAPSSSAAPGPSPAPASSATPAVRGTLAPPIPSPASTSGTAVPTSPPTAAPSAVTTATPSGSVSPSPTPHAT